VEVRPAVEGVHSSSRRQWRRKMLDSSINLTSNAGEARAVTHDKAPGTSKETGVSKIINKARNNHNKWGNSISLKEWVLEDSSQVIEVAGQ